MERQRLSFLHMLRDTLLEKLRRSRSFGDLASLRPRPKSSLEVYVSVLWPLDPPNLTFVCPLPLDMVGMYSSGGVDTLGLVQSLSVGCRMPCVDVCMFICMTCFKLFVFLLCFSVQIYFTVLFYLG